ncbi:MAG: DUF192 domain-containing protein [Candidatus Micrarchaeota archaeon]
MPNIKHFKITNGAHTAEAFFEICDSFNTRMRGLMFRPRPAYLFFKFDLNDLNPIHSFFVLFPFDAVYLDSNHKVVGAYEDVQPFTPYLEPNKPNKCLLEAPSGFIKSLQIKEGDKLKIEIE